MTGSRDLWGLPRSSWWVYPMLAALVVAGVALPAGWVAAAPTICPLHRTTGLHCPGCGLTRSFVATGDLRLGDALRHHPFGPPLFATLTVVAASGPWAARSRRSLFPAGPLRYGAVRCVVAAWVGWAVLRAVGLLPGP